MRHRLLISCLCLMSQFLPLTATASPLLNPPDGPPLLVWDNPQSAPYPKNFRTTNDAVKQPTAISLLGLNHLHASGSGQFSEAQLKKALEKMSGKVWIVDLRQESHGYVAGCPITWYGYENRGNQNRTQQAIALAESRALITLSQATSVTIATILAKDAGHITAAQFSTLVPQAVTSERRLVENLGPHYQRFYIQDRHPPSAETVDDFLRFVSQLPDDAWLHFHCRAGSGRTTTFLVMYDILRNGQQVPLADIIQRHALIGPKNLAVMPQHGPAWRLQAAEDRIAFIEAFYRYVTDAKGLGQQSWSSWKGTNF